LTGAHFPRRELPPMPMRLLAQHRSPIMKAFECSLTETIHGGPPRIAWW